ncbi:MAG TPA: ribulose-phosphate 3-epimerase, partial [Acidimicrobiales bacterium]|nr:ribulose-phosphate 3-epimerase [Acidimicrobiales bacterium]
LVLMMTVHPGFGGQAFMAEVIPKIRATSEEIRRRGLSTVIQVDGGIDPDTAPLTAEAGATVFVAGSAIFGHRDHAAAAASIRRAVNPAAGEARTWPRGRG